MCVYECCVCCCHALGRGFDCRLVYEVLNGVTDGARTHDNQNHNLALYQLNYGHHRRISNLKWLRG